MNKRDLVDVVANKTGLTKTDVQKVVDETIHTIVSYVSHESIRLEPLGTFRLVERSARIGRNPKTNEPINIPAKIAMGFKASKSAEDKLK